MAPSEFTRSSCWLHQCMVLGEGMSGNARKQLRAEVQPNLGKSKTCRGGWWKNEAAVINFFFFFLAGRNVKNAFVSAVIARRSKACKHVENFEHKRFSGNM